MTTGASADPSAGCPSRCPEVRPEEPVPSAFEEFEVSGACRSADGCEEFPLPAAQPTKIVAASAPRTRSVSGPRAILFSFRLVRIRAQPLDLLSS
jgi:hypothetical protein